MEERLVNPSYDFLLCIINCLNLEKKFKFDTSKIIKDELIDPNSSQRIHHACSMSIIVFHYLNKGSKVKIPHEKKLQLNPDLIIDNLNCDIKVIEEPDWTYRTDDDKLDLETGKTKMRDVSKDVNYDIGKFIITHGHRGIKQADVIFADLTFKSMGMTFIFNEAKRNELPSPKKNRIIFFARRNSTCIGFYVDYQPELWSLIKNTNEKYQMGFLPWLKKS